jgi:hypothetical protein
MTHSTPAIALFLFVFMVASSIAQPPARQVDPQSEKSWVTPEGTAPRASLHTLDNEGAVPISSVSSAQRVGTFSG